MVHALHFGGLMVGRTRRLMMGAAALALLASPAIAQTPVRAAPQTSLQTPPELEDDTELDGVVISATRMPVGSVIGDIVPEVVLTPRDIQAYGVASISELLDAIAPQTSSAQGSGGRPVVLINGARISGFAEIRDLPTEAIARVDILPEEVALKYGYPAEQKVVNMVLRQRFRAKLVEGSANTPTQSGGGGSVAGHGALLRIQQGTRTTLDARISDTGAILESDRDITAGDGDYRSLQPQSTTFALNGVLARPLGDKGVSGTINGLYEHSESESRLGLSPFGPQALLRNSSTDNGELSGVLSGAYGGWQWSSTANLTRTQSDSTTDRALGAAAFVDRTESTTTSAQADLVANKSLFYLPAGKVTTALTIRASTVELESDGVRLGAAQSTDLTRSIGELRANFDIPLLAAGEGPGKVLGKLSGNLNAGYKDLSDFGGLDTFGAGLNWTPSKPVRVLASFSQTDQAPTLNQLGDPVVSTPGVRVFDLTTGQTVEVTRVTGGSQGLASGERNVIKLGATYKPFDKTNLTFQANYVSSRNNDIIAAFPSASTQVEAAFPTRFVRDGAGTLVSIDARPVNFARQSRDELRWGFNYSRNLGPPPPTPEQLAAFRRQRQAQQGQGGAQGQAGQGQPGQQAGRPGQNPQAQGQNQGPPDGAPPGGPGGPPPGGFGGGFAGGGGPGGPGGPGGGRGGFGGFGGGGPRGGVFQFSLYHTVVFKDEILIRQGVPVLNLLDGAAIGSGGGSSRHQVDMQANVTKGGLGAAVNAKWQSSTRVMGSAGQDDLNFSDMTTVNLRLFADLGQQKWARTHPFLRGARATFAIDNIFDARQEVRTQAGVTPISYQPDLLDPVGRTVKITLRKLIF